ncbi:hypothetical protein Metme_2232 [Methylomonas methanica MC09]|uniref:Uncharacterized protein n=1 Tax=Methylomonas methanica (strain DSM 25384 / MC09) TaxID=857087 RepID=G0A7G6_METMM|nr:hypothetical protein Metme_2232 [Methylomonas methanica MC09]
MASGLFLHKLGDALGIIIRAIAMRLRADTIR